MIQQEYALPAGQHQELNPKLWSGQHLKSDVRSALLDIAQDFKKFCGVPFRVTDVVITGGNANYSYTKYSDIDLHLITDFDSVACADQEVAELFNTKRLLYKQEFNITILGIPVELYVEDSTHPAVSAGVYSIVTDQWRQLPQYTRIKYDAETVQYWAEIWQNILKSAMKTGNLAICLRCLKLLRTYRKLGLKSARAETSTPNLVYKSLRNDGTLASISGLVDRLHSQQLSLFSDPDRDS
jgi:hypothetical protein